tara:strand:+ start:44 stop:955 length:912 start_codon:yes stop_codon:yes gene_type:complete
MNNKEELDSLNTLLLLTNPIDSELRKNSEILKINNFIKIKYLENLNVIKKDNISFLDKDFQTIKKDMVDIDHNIKKKTSLINETIKYQETEIQRLYREKKLFEYSKIQSDIINNQEKLINNHKQNNTDLKFKSNEIEKELKKKDLTNRKFLINNTELKNTISRYITHNKKLQDDIIRLKKERPEISMSKSDFDEIKNKINFYQEENIRLSSEISIKQKDFEIMKNNFTEVESEKNTIYKQINELNNSLIKNNIVGTSFLKEKVKEDSINSKVLNDITNKNLENEKKKTQSDEVLNEQINDIFN